MSSERLRRQTTVLFIRPPKTMVNDCAPQVHPLGHNSYSCQRPWLRVEEEEHAGVSEALQNFAHRYRVFSNNLVLVRPTTNGFMRDPVVLLTRLPAIPHAATGARKTNLHEFLPTLNTHLLRNQITLLLDKCFQDPILFSYIFTLLSSTPPQRKCEPSQGNTTL